MNRRADDLSGLQARARPSRRGALGRDRRGRRGNGQRGRDAGRARAVRARRRRAVGRPGGVSDHRAVGGHRTVRDHRRHRRVGGRRPPGASAPARRHGPGLRARHHSADQLSRREGLGRRGAHHPGRQRHSVLDLALVPARAAHGARRHRHDGAARDPHERDDGADPRRARGALCGCERLRRAQDEQGPGGGGAVPHQRRRPRRRRAGKRHGGPELCPAERRDAGHARRHGRAAGGAVSSVDVVGIGHGAHARGSHHHGGGACYPSARSWSRARRPRPATSSPSSGSPTS